MNEESKPTTTSDVVTEQDKGRCAPAPGSATALHIWYLRPSGEAVGLMLPQGDSLDAALHVKEALEEGALSITVLREWVKPNQ